MSKQLLDGGSAKIRVFTNNTPADLATYNQAAATFPTYNVSAASITDFDEWTCVLNQCSVNTDQGTIDKTTFCSGRGEGIGAGRRSTQVAFDLIESKGYAVSTPNYLFQNALALPFILALDVDCTMSAMIVPTNRRTQAAAWNNFNGGWGGRADYSYIPPTYVWPASS